MVARDEEEGKRTEYERECVFVSERGRGQKNHGSRDLDLAGSSCVIKSEGPTKNLPIGASTTLDPISGENRKD